MRNAVPMRWIEQAEAREVIAASLFQLSPAPSWCGNARDAAAQWLLRLGIWCAERCRMDWLAAQPQPVLVRSAGGSTARRRGDGNEYRCCW